MSCTSPGRRQLWTSNVDDGDVDDDAVHDVDDVTSFLALDVVEVCMYSKSVEQTLLRKQKKADVRRETT